MEPSWVTWGSVMVVPTSRDPERWPLPTPGRAILSPRVSMGITSVLG